MDTQTQTNALVAVFKDRQSAEDARDQLLRNGFGSGQVEITNADDYAAGIASGNAALSGRHHDTSGGGISGWFHRIFGGGEANEEDRAYYSQALDSGRCAVVVHASDDMIDQAADILNDRGAIDVDTEPETNLKAESTYSSNVATGQNTDRAQIPVVEEQLQVGKRSVRRGGVRIYSNVTQQPVEENIDLREERVRVDRRPVDRPATDADLAAADRGVIEVTETVEEPVVAKTARVVEEVVVTKDVGERTEKVRDTVRRSDVRVEDTRSSGTSQVSDYDTDFRKDFQTRYGNTARYEDYAPAYQYGYEMASDPRYSGRSYEDVEDQLRADYQRRYPNSTWERIKDSVRYGWNKVTGRR